MMNEIFRRVDGVNKRKKCSICETTFSDGEVVFELVSSIFKSSYNKRYSHAECILMKQEILLSPRLYVEIYKKWSDKKLLEMI